MSLRARAVASAVQLDACGFGDDGEVRGLRTRLNAIDRGMSAAQVRQILGPPGDRSFRDQSEAWQFCETGMRQDTYGTVWFQDGVVFGVTTMNGALVRGSCSQAFPAIDWGQRPAGLVIEHRGR